MIGYENYRFFNVQYFFTNFFLAHQIIVSININVFFISKFLLLHLLGNGKNNDEKFR